MSIASGGRNGPGGYHESEHSPLAGDWLHSQSQRYSGVMGVNDLATLGGLGDEWDSTLTGPTVNTGPSSRSVQLTTSALPFMAGSMAPTSTSTSTTQPPPPPLTTATTNSSILGLMSSHTRAGSSGSGSISAGSRTSSANGGGGSGGGSGGSGSRINSPPGRGFPMGMPRSMEGRDPRRSSLNGSPLTSSREGLYGIMPPSLSSAAATVTATTTTTGAMPSPSTPSSSTMTSSAMTPSHSPLPGGHSLPATTGISGNNGGATTPGGERKKGAGEDVDITKLRSGEETRSAVMIRNIPNRFSPDELREILDLYVKGM